ncbi:MAG: class I SAM-dependent methyltransferase [Candidatus Sulfotelmatobacter sp.]|jgi:2-polyprenyl-3-methyl-5-hydroxy-6-metoxy-1,4-benzoquinol methylase
MHLAKKARNVLRGVVQKYGPQSVKRSLWNAEFSTGQWDCLNTTGGEGAHPQVEKYANGGSVLDLGCGPGTIAVELNPASYTFYMGVDISDVAVEKAAKRAQETGRSERNQYRQSDILTYNPDRRYDVILYGDSIYYIPPRQVGAMLQRYSSHLTGNGVFIARLFDVSGKLRYTLDAIENHFDIVEKKINQETHVCIIVFRPAAQA